MLAPPGIIAIIITYNPEIGLLEKEYKSIISQVDYIIYVDNKSDNCEEIRKWGGGLDNVSFIWRPKNEGLGVAQNIGIKKALKEGASHVIIFDQDSIVDDDFVCSLINVEKKALSDGINVGLVGPVYRSYKDNYAYPIWSVEEGRLINIPQENIHDYCVVTHIIASGSLIRRETIEKVGLMCEELFLGFIDYEYCFRAAWYGFHSIVTNRASMHHLMGDNQIEICGRKIGLYSPFRRYFDCRNTLLIQRMPFFPKPIKRYYLKIIFVKFLISIIYGPHRMKQIYYCLRGFYDGILGRFGMCSIR